MSRERPATLPRVLPDAAQRAQPETPHQRHQREELERLKNFSGPGFFGAFDALMTTRVRPPQFIRRGYEANIIDELNDFYTRRPRPWRQRHRQAGATFKERVKAQRRKANGHA